MNLIGLKLKLQELPNLRFGNPNVSVGVSYEVIDIEGSNLWVIDDDGVKVSFNRRRFLIN